MWGNRVCIAVVLALASAALCASIDTPLNSSLTHSIDSVASVNSQKLVEPSIESSTKLFVPSVVSIGEALDVTVRHRKSRRHSKRRRSSRPRRVKHKRRVIRPRRVRRVKRKRQVIRPRRVRRVKRKRRVIRPRRVRRVKRRRRVIRPRRVRRVKRRRRVIRRRRPRRKIIKRNRRRRAVIRRKPKRVARRRRIIRRVAQKRGIKHGGHRRKGKRIFIRGGGKRVRIGRGRKGRGRHRGGPGQAARRAAARAARLAVKRLARRERAKARRRAAERRAIARANARLAREREEREAKLARSRLAAKIAAAKAALLLAKRDAVIAEKRRIQRELEEKRQAKLNMIKKDLAGGSPRTKKAYPEWCYCKKQYTNANSLCYYFTPYGTPNSCQARQCRTGYQCVDKNSGMYCIRKRRTEKIVPTGVGTCETVKYEHFTYVPYGGYSLSA